MNDLKNNVVAAEAEKAPFNRYHKSGASTLNREALGWLVMPIIASWRLDIERLKVAQLASDRLATCVLGASAVNVDDIEARFHLVGEPDEDSHRIEDLATSRRELVA